MTHNTDDQMEKMPPYTKEFFELLKKCAFNLTTISYGELVKGTDVLPIGAGKQLEYIRDKVCRKHGWPWLSVLAVNAETGQPGDGWMPSKGIEIAEQQDRERLWRGMVLQVYGYDWSKAEIESE